MKNKAEKIINCLMDYNVYKGLCISAFMLLPTFIFCFKPQIISALFLLYGGIILIRDLFKKRIMFSSSYSMILMLFVISYVITLIFYFKNDIASTLNLFLWIILEFFLFFTFKQKEKNDIFSSITKINKPIIFTGFVVSIVCLIVFVTKIAVIIPDPEGLNTAWVFGITNGRASGIFNNPIPFGAAMFLAFVASCWNFVGNRKNKEKLKAIDYIYIVTAVLSFINIETTLTRTYVVAKMLFIGLSAFLFFFFRYSNKGNIKKWFAGIVAGVVFAAGAAALGNVSKKALVFAVKNVDPKLHISSEFNVEGEENSEEYFKNKYDLNSEVTLDRHEISRLPSFFYPRNEWWKIGLQVIPHSPIFGFTSGNRVSSSLQYGSSDYFEKYLPDGIPTYHNAYIDIAVSAGLLGLGLILIFLFLIMFRALRVILFNKGLKKEDNINFSLMVAFCLTHIFFVSLFFGLIIFTNICVCLYFWMMLGALNSFMTNNCEFKEKMSVNNVLKKLIKKG